MSKQFADSIYIVTNSPGRATEIRDSISLRGFDQIKCFPLEQMLQMADEQLPDLVILDAENQAETALKVIKKIPKHVPVIFLAEAFHEEFFLTCYDAGARDFLVKPVNSAYLVSRVLMVLDEGRLKNQLGQKDQILRELAVLGAYSNVFTTEYLVKMLKNAVEKKSADSPLALLVLQLEVTSGSVPDKKMFYGQVADILRRCCRSSDVIGEYFEDKFAIILPETGLNGGEAVAKRILENLDGQSLTLKGQTVTLKVQIGVADFKDCRHYEDLLNKTLEGLKIARQENLKAHMV